MKKSIFKKFFFPKSAPIYNMYFPIIKSSNSLVHPKPYTFKTKTNRKKYAPTYQQTPCEKIGKVFPKPPLRKLTSETFPSARTRAHNKPHTKTYSLQNASKPKPPQTCTRKEKLAQQPLRESLPARRTATSVSAVALPMHSTQCMQ